MYHLSSRPKPCRGWKASYKLFFRKSKLRLWSFQLAQWARMWQRHGYLLPASVAFNRWQPSARTATHTLRLRADRTLKATFSLSEQQSTQLRLQSSFAYIGLHVAPLFSMVQKHETSSGGGFGRSAARFCTLSFALQCIPRKPRSAPPFGAQDGGGIYSLPDWSLGPRYAEDQLQSLLREWQQWLLEKHVPARLSQHVAEHRETPLFTEAETAWLRSSFCRFSSTLSPASDWDFEVAEGQPYCLSALARLSTLLGDKDTSLFPALQQGVPTGFDNDIPRSYTLRPCREAEPDEGHDLLACEGNWQGAESEPDLLQELIEEELASGYLEELPSLEAAYARC